MKLSRRIFLGSAAALLPRGAVARTPDIPLIDLHVHAEGEMTVERAARIAQERGVKIGIAEHGGCGLEMGSDESLLRYVERLAPHPVFKGMQAEGHDWMRCFSREALAKLDFILADALVFPEKDGRHVRLWTQEAKITDKQDFMDRYVDFNVQVISLEPIHIFANPTFLPEAIAGEYDALWTKERMWKVIEAAAKRKVAIEINSLYRIPSEVFIRMAKEAGVRFTFGSNSHGDGIGRLDYCLEMARRCGLARADFFVPG